MQLSVKSSIADWYNVLHTEDWQHEPLKTGEKYYLIESTTEYIDVVSTDDIRIYLDLDRETSESKVLDKLDNKLMGWSMETATGEE